MGTVDLIAGIIAIVIYLTQDTILGPLSAFIAIVTIIKGFLSIAWTSSAYHTRIFYPEQHTHFLFIVDILAGLVILLSKLDIIKFYGLIMIGKGSVLLISYIQSKLFKG